MLQSRRNFLRGLGAAALAAPAIVHAGNLMPIKPVRLLSPQEELYALLMKRTAEAYALIRKNLGESLYSDSPGNFSTLHDVAGGAHEYLVHSSVKWIGRSLNLVDLVIDEPGLVGWGRSVQA